MPIVYYQCLTSNQALNLTENLSAFLKYRHMANRGFFKTCKSTLNLAGECRSLSYDALTAHVAIVFTRYMLLALEQRKDEDQRTLGELFFFLVDEMTDITFSHSLCLIIDAMLASIQELLKLSDEQLSTLTADFESRLPEYLKNALHRGESVA